MSPRNKKRAVMLARLQRWLNVRLLMKELNLSAREVADEALKAEAMLVKAFGGPAQFTGNNHVFANGAVAYEVRCKKCHGWRRPGVSMAVR